MIRLFDFFNMKHKLAVLLCLSFLCSCSFNLNLNKVSYSAEFTIANVNTGKVLNSSSASSYYLMFKHGEMMRIQFLPPNKNAYRVRIKVLDIDTTIEKYPYIYEMTIPDDVPVGSYMVICSAQSYSVGENNTYNNTICKEQSVGFRIE